MKGPAARAPTKPVLWALLAMLVGSCGGDLPTEPAYDNPLDPDRPTYIVPETSILTGPADGEVVDHHSVTFTLGGNESVTEFSYRVTGSDWSPWSANATVNLGPFDESGYTFEAKGRYATGDEDDTPESRSFTIDDIRGPAMWLSPRKVEVATGNNFTLSLFAEDVTDLKALEAGIEFDWTKMEVVDYQVRDASGQFLTQHNANVIAIIEPHLAEGAIDFYLALVGGDQLGVDGSGIVLDITFRRTAAGSTYIILVGGCRMINSDLAEITLTELAPTEVVTP